MVDGVDAVNADGGGRWALPVLMLVWAASGLGVLTLLIGVHALMGDYSAGGASAYAGKDRSLHQFGLLTLVPALALLALAGLAVRAVIRQHTYSRAFVMACALLCAVNTAGTVTAISYSMRLHAVCACGGG